MTRALLAVLLIGCATASQRPATHPPSKELAWTPQVLATKTRYAEVVSTGSIDAVVRLQLVEEDTGTPVGRAMIMVGDPSNLTLAPTTFEGYFVLPVEQRLIDEDALISVFAPQGIERTRVVRAPFPEAPTVHEKGPDVTEPQLRMEILAPYPIEAQAAGVQGTVRMRLVIDPEGLVRCATVLAGRGSGLDEAALDGVVRAIFYPARVQVTPVWAAHVYNYTFILDE